MHQNIQYLLVYFVFVILLTQNMQSWLQNFRRCIFWKIGPHKFFGLVSMCKKEKGGKNNFMPCVLLLHMLHSGLICLFLEKQVYGRTQKALEAP